MTDVPLRNIFLSDFRRFEGHISLPLDAPTVLIHGSNGAGKTSVLSALELALTGEIRSMRRHDSRYTAHLPFHGRDFATLRVEVSDRLGTALEPATMTVGGSRVDGAPALDADTAQSYAERCYLDQVSLGQLLELYQYREGKEESALARFVNELLGLEELDNLRVGLSDAKDFRRLKKLSDHLNDAETTANNAANELSQVTERLEQARGEQRSTQESLESALEALGLQMPEGHLRDMAAQISLQLNTIVSTGERSRAAEIDRRMTALSGRIDGLEARPSAKRQEEAREAVVAASEEYDNWRAENEEAIDSWRADAAELGVPTSGDQAAELGAQVARLEREFARQDHARSNKARVESQLAVSQEHLSHVQSELATAQEEAGSLVEGLAALRDHATENACPVCDRDFGEVSSTHLTAHIDEKVRTLTDQGVRLRDLRNRRNELQAEIQEQHQSLEHLNETIMSDSELEAANLRQSSLEDLRRRFSQIGPAIDAGVELHAKWQNAKSLLEELEAIGREASIARSELEQAAQDLEVEQPSSTEPLRAAWRRIASAAADRLEAAEMQVQAHATATEALDKAVEADDRVEQLREMLAASAERKATWDNRIKEARRRQKVAKEVEKASSATREDIVHRVFTEDLNEVWRSVFTRIAPREPFIPTFGLPSTTRSTLQVELETVHMSGESGGSPQVMLSAGNLNTAALSLFIALHLAVEPVMPCLVLDDPVQSMDHVHVAQFAGLIRMLSKHHNRQVIIAVHEKELFEYLALEMSPAFPGDELITIELDSRASGDDFVRRHSWEADPAIAL